MSALLMHLADLVQGANHSLSLQHCNMDNIDTRLVEAVERLGQEPSWQFKVLKVLGNESTAVKEWFIRLSQPTAVAEANKMLNEGEHSPCHGDRM